MQTKELPDLRRLGQERHSGLLEGYSCCLLSREPTFLEPVANSAEVSLLSHYTACRFAQCTLALDVLNEPCMPYEIRAVLS